MRAGELGRDRERDGVRVRHRRGDVLRRRAAQSPRAVLITVSVPAHDTVAVNLSEPAIAPRRAFAAKWCLGASQFSSPATADMLVTVEGYRL